MKTHLRVFAIVVFILVIGCGTASAYSKSESMQSVVINMDGAPRMVSTDKETVGELLEDLADTIDTEFYLEDAKESDPIEAMMTLSLTSVTEKTVATTEAIAYKTVERTNSSLKAGESRVVQEGKEGVASVIKKEIYHGSELVDTQFVEKKVVTQRNQLLIRQILDANIRVDTGRGKRFLGTSTTHTKDVGEGDLDALLIGDVDSGKTCHCDSFCVHAGRAPSLPVSRPGPAYPGFSCSL